MPLYEDKHNAENILHIDAKYLSGAYMGWEKAVAALKELAAEGAVLALDGWYGVEFDVIRAKMEEAGVKAKWIETLPLFRSLEALKAYIIRPART